MIYIMERWMQEKKESLSTRLSSPTPPDTGRGAYLVHLQTAEGIENVLIIRT